eukprot:g1047.t1
MSPMNKEGTRTVVPGVRQSAPENESPALSISPKRASFLEPNDIDNIISRLDTHIDKIEKFLTINHELTSDTRFSVKRQTAQVEFLHLSGKVRDLVVENRESRPCMRAMFDQSDRAARLMYIHDTAFHLVEGGFGQAQAGHLMAKTPNFARPIRAALEQQKIHCEPWEVLHQKGALRVGFGPALDPDYRDTILREAGKYVEPPKPPTPPPEPADDSATPTAAPASAAESEPPAEETQEPPPAPERDSPESSPPRVMEEPPRPVVEMDKPTPATSSTSTRPENVAKPGPSGFVTTPCARFAQFRGDDACTIFRKRDYVKAIKNPADVEGGSSDPDDPLQFEDDVLGMTNAPVGYFPDHGYYVEIEVDAIDDPSIKAGCMGLGVTFMRPHDLKVAADGATGTSPPSAAKLPKRLEKLKQGWFFTGPYKGGSTRRVYRHGKKDIRFILDGEEAEPLRWSVGDKMSLLIRPKDVAEADWQWTISLYINRNIVLACTIDVPPSEDGSFQGVPKSLELYACAEAYGYVNAIKLNPTATPHGLAIAGLKAGAEDVAKAGP